MKVTILIVNYNNWKDTIECLESVFKSRYKDLEVIVVDNSPNDDSVNYLQEWAKGNIKIKQTRFPELVYPEQKKPLDFILVSEKEFYNIHTKNNMTIVKAKSNNGFAAANNIVLKKLLKSNKDNSFVFLLNNDTVIPPDTITNLINNYKNTNIGVAGCTLLEYNNPKKIQSVGGLYDDFWGITSQVLEGVELEEFKNQEGKVKIDYPVGAAMFLSTEVLKDIGVLNEEYFLYYEELDWIANCRKKYETTYFDNCFVYHKGSSSIGANSKSYISEKYSILNRIKFAKKYNRKFLTTVYAGVLLTIIKRFFSLRINLGFKLLKELVNNEN
ncbi:MAG: glycosyltransferase family 2 protein [Maribacter sp.]